jgi:hypothetical protein
MPGVDQAVDRPFSGLFVAERLLVDARGNTIDSNYSYVLQPDASKGQTNGIQLDCGLRSSGYHQAICFGTIEEILMSAVKKLFRGIS